MLSCENLLEESCSLVDNQLDQDLILRQISPYSATTSEDLKRLLNSEDSFIPTQHGKHHLVEDIFRLGSTEEDDEQSAITETRLAPKIVCGSELNESPARYEVKGLLPHEMPVIGVYVDKHICPGFRYKVRYNGRDETLFDGKARALVSIGMGYGKRLTFEGDSLNYNDHYFWSDSDPKGYAFSLEVVSPGDDFVIYNALSEPVGKVKIESILGHQEETNHETRVGSVCKTVRVIMTCSIDYYQRHQLLDLHSKDMETIEGEVMVVKERRAKKAVVECVRNVNFSRLGKCTLQIDQ